MYWRFEAVQKRLEKEEGGTLISDNMATYAENPRVHELLKPITELKQDCTIYGQNVKINLYFYIAVTTNSK